MEAAKVAETPKTEIEHVSAAPVERGIAVGTVAAPFLTGIAAPFLDPNAGLFVTTLGVGWAGLAGAAFSGLLHGERLRSLPAGDIIEAQREPMFASALATVWGVATGTMLGPQGTDSLVAGFLDFTSIEGAMSCAWWSLTGYTALKLRRVLRSAPRKGAPAKKAKGGKKSEVDQILHLWHEHISGPEGLHVGNELTVWTHSPEGWNGRIEAPAGKAVEVSAETISSLYQVPVSQVFMAPGASMRHMLLTVLLQEYGEGTAGAGLAGEWQRRVAAKGKLLPGTHLEQIQTDPKTGAQVAYVVAGDDSDMLPRGVDPIALAGALRIENPLLLAYEAGTNPRKAVVRLFDKNPLETPTPLPDPGVLDITEDGCIEIGVMASGAPAEIQVYDHVIGALHLGVFGVTGSGKGGVIQLVSLALHRAGFAIIYVDPKGSSNPTVERMAAFSGTTLENSPQGSIGALRVAYGLLEHRKTLGMQNFVESPGCPRVLVVVDEIDKLVNHPEYGDEAALIISGIASQARSLGITLLIAGQMLNADKIGGTDIRNNVLNGGSLVLLRTDSAQTNLTDLPDSFAGVDPSRIPACWTPQDPVLVYSRDRSERPLRERTFGLGYVSTGAPSMFRTYFLTAQQAVPLMRAEGPVLPLDWPRWDDRMAIASTEVTDKGSPASPGKGATLESFMGQESPTRSATVRDEILHFLESRDPLAGPVTFQELKDATGRPDSSLSNVLGKLGKEGRITGIGTGKYSLVDDSEE